MRFIGATLLLMLIVTPARLCAHGGTSHSAEMSVDNQLALARDAITLTQTHTCTGKMAEDLWLATDADGDGKLSDTEWSKCVEDSRTVYQQWCRVEVDWKTVLPAGVEVKLASFPRTKPTTFAGVSLVIEHAALYPAPEASSVRNLAFNCTNLNAKLINSRVRCAPGLRVETASLGKIEDHGTTVSGMVQQDGSPDQVALVVRFDEGTGAPASGGHPRGLAGASSFELDMMISGFLLWLFGVYYLVSSAVAYGRLRALQKPGGLWAIAGSFAIIGVGIGLTLRALITAGCLIVNL